MVFHKAPYSVPCFFYSILMISQSAFCIHLIQSFLPMTIKGSDPREFLNTVNNSIININISL